MMTLWKRRYQAPGESTELVPGVLRAAQNGGTSARNECRSERVTVGNSQLLSDQASVASATVSCWKCHSRIEIICLYCERGSVSGEALNQLTVSNVWAMDGVL